MPIAIREEDLLTPFSVFEKEHDITKTRHDIPTKFLGASPSKYYKIRDMDVEKQKKAVSKLFKKVYGSIPNIHV